MDKNIQTDTQGPESINTITSLTNFHGKFNLLHSRNSITIIIMIIILYSWKDIQYVKLYKSIATQSKP